jgi:hypothetical protein
VHNPYGSDLASEEIITDDDIDVLLGQASSENEEDQFSDLGDDEESDNELNPDRLPSRMRTCTSERNYKQKDCPKKTFTP